MCKIHVTFQDLQTFSDLLGNECRALQVIDPNVMSDVCSDCPKRKEDSTHNQQLQVSAGVCLKKSKEYIVTMQYKTRTKQSHNFL